MMTGADDDAVVSLLQRLGHAVLRIFLSVEGTLISPR
jgi:hypothetical protein